MTEIDQPSFSPSEETRRADPSEQIKARVRQVMEEIRACTPGARLADVPTLFAFGPIERALTEAASAEDDWIRIATKNAEDGLARQAALEAEIRTLRATLTAARGLAGRWRDHADLDSDASTDAYDVCLRVCADELEALLASLPVRPEQQDAEAPTCEEHGTMVADDEMGRSWHCAACPAVAAPQEEP